MSTTDDDFGTAHIVCATQFAELDFDLLDELFRAEDLDEQARVLARVVLEAFSNYYAVSRRIPRLAKAAFEARDWPATLQLSRDRLTMYTACLDQLAPVLRSGLPETVTDERVWEAAEADFLAAIAPRYEADFAFAFWHSLRRKLLSNEWLPVSYVSGATAARGKVRARPVIKSFATTVPIGPDLIRTILELAAFAVPWRDIDGDAALVAAEIATALERLGPRDGETAKIEMADSCFFRNRGACLIGRIALRDRGDSPLRNMPLLIALLNEEDGLFVDAALCDADEVQYEFSSTLANFHATNPHYHELAQFLSELMPKSPRGLYYSTIGYHHLGKVAVMEEILAEHRRSKEKLAHAPGVRGTVAIGFTMPSSHYVLKIIRDHPTDGYRWDKFEGLDSVLGKYRMVHETDRAGSMVDNVIYTNVKLERAMFAPELLDELLEAGIGTVSLDRSALVFRHLIVQLKLVPLPLFLGKAKGAEARAAVINLGDCIRNNAAANIFNKDLDGRNYGVSRILKVYLFDHDKVQPLTGVSVRSNQGGPPGERAVPDGLFGDSTVFLPEEILTGLRIDDPALRKVFRDAHPDLLQVGYWQDLQRALREGEVPAVTNYPAARRLRR